VHSARASRVIPPAGDSGIAEAGDGSGANPAHSIEILNRQERTAPPPVLDDARRQAGSNPRQRLELFLTGEVQIHPAEPLRLDCREGFDRRARRLSTEGSEPWRKPVANSSEDEQQDNEPDQPLLSLGRSKNLDRPVEHAPQAPPARRTECGSGPATAGVWRLSR
jgi:hypothetical protein